MEWQVAIKEGFQEEGACISVTGQAGGPEKRVARVGKDSTELGVGDPLRTSLPWLPLTTSLDSCFSPLDKH